MHGHRRAPWQGCANGMACLAIYSMARNSSQNVPCIPEFFIIESGWIFLKYNKERGYIYATQPGQARSWQAGDHPARGAAAMPMQADMTLHRSRIPRTEEDRGWVHPKNPHSRASPCRLTGRSRQPRPARRGRPPGTRPPYPRPPVPRRSTRPTVRHRPYCAAPCHLHRHQEKAFSENERQSGPQPLRRPGCAGNWSRTWTGPPPPSDSPTLHSGQHGAHGLRACWGGCPHLAGLMTSPR